MVRISRMAAIAAAALALSACGGPADDKASLEKLDTKLGGKGDVDPALTAALEDQIMVDPTLSGQANEDSIRPPTEPQSAPIPAAREGDDVQTLGGLATDQAITASKDRFTGCSLDVQYSAEWANRLPSDLPLYPQARVAECWARDVRQDWPHREHRGTGRLQPRALELHHAGRSRQMDAGPSGGDRR